MVWWWGGEGSGVEGRGAWHSVVEVKIKRKILAFY